MNLFWWLPFGKVPEITAEELNTLNQSENRPQIIDVRTMTEWQASHIDGSVSVPVTELKSRLKSLQLNHDRPIITICLSAHRSITAVRLLQRYGFHNAKQLKGGMLAWWKVNLPTKNNADKSMS